MIALFVICAILGSTLLLLQLLAGALDFDGGFHDVNLDHETPHLDHESKGSSLNLKSFRGFAAGFAFFGMIGGLATSYGASPGLSILAGLVAASLAYVGMAKLIAKFVATESNGAINYQEAVGQVGTVYRTITRFNQGVVSVSIRGMLVQLPAACKLSDDFQKSVILRFGDRVKILNLSGGTAIVEPAESN